MGKTEGPVNGREAKGREREQIKEGEESVDWDLKRGGWVQEMGV